MKSETKVPELFVAVAKQYGIPVDIACQLYTVKFIGKQSWTHIQAELVKENHFDDLAAARTAGNETIKAFKTKIAMGDTADLGLGESLGALLYDNHMEKARKAFEKEIGPLKKVKYEGKKGKKTATVREIVCSDFHIPFHNTKALEKLLTMEADVLTIVGDFLDLYSATRFLPGIHEVSLREELAMGRQILEQLVKRFKKVRIMVGNHDNRARKRMQEMLPNLGMLLTHPVDLICTNLPVEIMSTEIGGMEPNLGRDPKVFVMDQLAFREDCAFSHMEAICGADAAKKASDFIDKIAHLTKKDKPRVVFHAHTHRLGASYERGQMMINSGCMSKVQEYVLEQATRYSIPENGFIVLHKENGKTIFEKTEIHYIWDEE